MPVYKDKNGTWFAKFRYRDWTGTTCNKTKRGFSTRREALKWESEFKAMKSDDIDMNFETFVKKYIEERFPRLKETTRATKVNIIETKIVPYFGKKNISEITTADILKWQNELIEYRDPDTGAAYSKSYLKTIHNQINAIFNYARKFYKLKINPAGIAGNMGSEADIQMEFWTTEEYLKFSEAMMDAPIAYYAFQVLYWAGIREGEMLALAKSDFDFDKKTLTISKNYQVVNGKHLITSPKTKKSNRVITIPDFLCEEMQEYFEKLTYVDDDERIFSSLSKSILYRYIKSGSKKAGVKKIRVHDLRHSHVSLLINMGYSPVAIAQRMGHESVHITLRYAHMFPTVQADMASDLDRLMEDKNNVRKKP